MNYLKEVVDLADAIRASAERIQVLEKARRDWDRPNDPAGTRPVEAGDPQGHRRQDLLRKKSWFEGLRFKLVNIAKAGGQHDQT